MFSRTLRDVGPNVRLVADDVENVVKSVRSGSDGNISVAGAGLAATLSRLGLIDECQLFIHPLVLGGGRPFFEAGTSMKLKPLGTQNLAQDVVMLRYAPTTGGGHR